VKVDIDRLRLLLDVLIEKDVAEFEHEDTDVKVRIVRGVRGGAPAIQVAAAGAGAASANAALRAEPSPAAAAEDADSFDVTSPFVGTFYRAPSPDTPPFVELGSVIRAGQTLCIVEAMKLMNEIEAEHSGTIVEVYAQNGKAVEFGQKLFRIKKA
jgi:acetyl-CoA carboxylase biotin carboxyl carrier protein